nr:caffeic acid 3-O-methyltransferase-like [Tanacetum cinerariifolium]
MDSSSQEDSKMSREEEGLLRVNQINAGMLLPMVIKTALELDLFEIMAKSPGGQFSAFDLASSLPKQSPETPALIERLLRFLASQSVLTSKVVTDEHGDSKTLYGMTYVSNYYVRKEDGTSHASTLLLIYDKVLVDCWYHLKDAVVEGGVPFDKAHGVNAFEYPAKDNRFNEVFNKCMYDETRIVMKMILEKYKGFEGVKELTDVGGGLGANLELIVSKYPNIKGINFDLPHVIKDAPPYPGVEHVGGDMFKSVPKGDVIFMKWILHDWGDNYCITLLKNCWAALPECGKVVVVEVIMPDPEHISSTDEVSKTALGSDLIMLIANPGGKERTVKDYNALATEAGFTSLKIVCRVSTFCIMEFYKSI